MTGPSANGPTDAVRLHEEQAALFRDRYDSYRRDPHQSAFTYDRAGIDMAWGMLRFSREAAPASPVVYGDVRALPFATAAFDALVLVEVLRSLHDPDRALAEYRARRCRPRNNVKRSRSRAGSCTAGSAFSSERTRTRRAAVSTSMRRRPTSPRRAGYACACTTINGVNGPAVDLYELRRTNVLNEDDMLLFRYIMWGALDWLAIKDFGGGRAVQWWFRNVFGY